MQTIENAASETEVTEDETEFTGTATYCPEDDKLRLYVGRVPREEYLKLRAEGWVSTPKQDCDFVAVWTPGRRDTALGYAGCILAEDDGPEERAADRAERFGGYLEKRLDEAGGHADRYDSGPRVHGYQNRARGVRAADRHDRIAGRAVDAWDKAEYWQGRTAGIIRHALHKSSPGVRMGRIKTLEAEQRKCLSGLDNYALQWKRWEALAAIEDPDRQAREVRAYVNSVHCWAEYLHPRLETVTNARLKEHPSSLYTLLTMVESGYGSSDITGAEAVAFWFSDHAEPKGETAWSKHYELRLAYENAMLEAQGGRAAFVEMEAGGWFGKHQVQKVNKSPATGRVVSVCIYGPTSANYDRKGKAYGEDNPRPETIHTINVERFAADAYRAPTDEERAAFLAARKAEKKERAATAVVVPLVNPTDDDAERLQELWNEKARKPEDRQKVVRMTQAQYSARSSGTYCTCEALTVCEEGTGHRGRHYNNVTRHDVFKVRKTSGYGNGFYLPERVIILTDKPQKALPWAAMEKARALCPSKEKLWSRLPELAKLLCNGRGHDLSDSLLCDGEYVGWVDIQSTSQVYWTEKGAADWKAFQEESAAAPARSSVPAPVLVDSSSRVQSEFVLA